MTAAWVLAVLVVVAPAVAGPPRARYVRLASGALLPDPIVTPGATRPVTVADLCRPGSATQARDEARVTPSVRAYVVGLYGMGRAKPAAYELDHLIPLELGGAANSAANLWPEPYRPTPGAREKDGVEGWLHREVCAGRMTLARAQYRIRTNWVAVYLEHQTPAPTEPR